MATGINHNCSADTEPTHTTFRELLVESDIKAQWERENQAAEERAQRHEDEAEARKWHEYSEIQR